MSNETFFTIKYVQYSHPALLGMSHRCKDKAAHKCVGGKELQRILFGKVRAWRGRERERAWAFWMNLWESTVTPKPFRIEEFSLKRKDV